MSKRKIPDPPLPTKMTHYDRHVSEDDIDSILKDSIRTARHASKKLRKDSDLIEGEYGQRRIDALKSTITRITEDYTLTARTNGLVPSIEIWANLNLFTANTIEDVDGDASLFLAAALWVLDNTTDRFDLECLLEEVDYKEDWTLPFYYDPNHTDPVIEAVIYILKNRYKNTKSFLDVDDGPGNTGEAFEKLLNLLDPARLRHAVATARAIFWKNVDAFFEAEYALADHFMEGVATYNNAVDLYNEQVDRAIREIKAFTTWKNRDTNPAFNSLQKAGSPLMQPSADPFSAFMAPSPRDFLNREPKEPDHFTRLKSSVELLESAGKRAEKLFETAHDLYSDMVRFVFDYPYAGFTFANDYVCHYEGVELPVTPVDVPDPYEASMGLLMLCSPPALRSLYDGIPGAAVEADLQLPWLTGIITGVARDIASHLPWGVNVFEEDQVEFRKPSKPLSHADFYKLKYEGKDGYKRNLSQILYETTGAVLPRNMSEYDDTHHILWSYGIRGKNEIHMAELMVLLSDPQYRTNMMLTPSVHEEEDGSSSEDAAELKDQIKKLRDLNKKLADEAHEQERRARKAEQALSTEKEKIAADRRELASLREVVFAGNADSANNGADERISVNLPYEVRQRIVVFGGHDSWRKPMKELLTGDIRFMDKDQAIVDRTVIRNADVVWIQTNAISHRQYYAIIDEIRKTGTQVRYFLYASARKCAEQVILNEQGS